MEKVFVYGSLREGMYNYDQYLKGKVITNTKAYVKGTLYSIKDVRYPALLDGDEWIVGEIIEVSDPSIWSVLDTLEEYIDEGNVDNAYDKKLVNIYDENHTRIEQLYVYFFNMQKESHQGCLDKKIIHGDYVKYIQEHDKVDR